jgi:hypothetical protein
MAWSCAAQHIAAHGVDAAEMAAMRADDCLAAGDMDGHRQWLDILARVRNLQSARSGETLH